MIREVYEYDGYVVKTPYVGKKLTDEERTELKIKREEARKKTLELIKSLNEEFG